MDRFTTPRIAVLLLSACGGQATTPAAATTPEELSATIGPSGGVIEGPKDGLFGSVRLEIPAGALTTATKIVIQGGSESIRLPLVGEQVGPTIRFEPEGLELRAPAKLTLVADDTEIDRHGLRPEDCKVWQRKDDSWTRLDPVATSTGSVTVEITRLLPASAGVLIASSRRLPACAACIRAAIAILAPACQFRYCRDSLGIPSTLPSSEFEVQGNAAYYISRVTFGTSRLLHGIRYDFGTQAVTRTVGLTPTTPEVFRNVSVERNGAAVWAATGAGNARFPFGNNSPFVVDNVRDDTPPNGIGAMVVSDGTIARIRVHHFDNAPLGGDDATILVQQSNGTTRNLFASYFGQKTPISRPGTTEKRWSIRVPGGRCTSPPLRSCTRATRGPTDPRGSPR